MITVLLISLAVILFIIYIWQSITYSYWRRLKIKHLSPIYFLGNCQDLLCGVRSLGEQIYQWYNAEGMSNQTALGVYLVLQPTLLLRDLNLIRLVMIRKFHLFKNRQMRADRLSDPLSVHNAYYARFRDWQAIRTKVTPIFASPKLKAMYPLIVQMGKQLEQKLSGFAPGTFVEVKDICLRYVSDVIGSIAFNHEVKALRNQDNEFFTESLNFNRNVFKRSFDFAIMSLLPSMTQFSTIKVIAEKTTDLMRSIIDEKIVRRENSNEKRGDLIDTLVEMRREANAAPFEPNLAFDYDFLTGQSAMFKTNGFDPCAATITFALYELAFQPSIQNRLRAEITKYFGRDEKIAYERIQDMPYLNQVVNETLRKYPPHPYIERQCSAAAPPLGERVSLAPYLNFVVPPGMPVYVSVLGIHRDQKYWHEPMKFNPERFSPQNKHRIVPDSFMPFGIGSRNCVGMRLAYLIVKVGLVHFLRNHRVSTCNKTVDCIHFEPMATTLRARDEIYLRID